MLSVIEMLPRVLFVTSLILVFGDSFASECRCKLPHDNLFHAAKCPAITLSSPVAPAIVPSMSYSSIDLDDFMSLLGKLAGVSVCLGKETRGRIEFSSTKLEPWPVVVNSVVEKYGLNAAFENTSVYLYGQIQ